MSEENETSYYDYTEIQVIINIKNYFLIVQCIGACIELIFFFVMFRNWCTKRATSFQNAFFYLTALKTLNDFIFILYMVSTGYWESELDDFFNATQEVFFVFNLEFDILCQFAISINRFTALIMTLKHEKVSLDF